MNEVTVFPVTHSIKLEEDMLEASYSRNLMRWKTLSGTQNSRGNFSFSISNNQLTKLAPIYSASRIIYLPSTRSFKALAVISLHCTLG